MATADSKDYLDKKREDVRKAEEKILQRKQELEDIIYNILKE